MLDLGENKPLRRPSALPTIWRRCVDVIAGNRSSKTEPTASSLALTAPVVHDTALPDWRRPALFGYLVIVLAFVVCGAWSAFAELADNIAAPGVVSLASSRKIIQHFESGIVAKILVHEGQHVRRGQVLFVLDDTAARANTIAIQNQLYALLAEEARLLAERAGAPQVNYPQQLIKDNTAPIVKNAVADENKQFLERRAALTGEVNLLNSQIEQYETQIQGISDEKTAAKTQLGLVDSELDDLHGLLERNLVQKTRVLSLESERSRLAGVIGQADADIAKAKEDMAEVRLQIDQVHKKFAEDVNKQILQVRENLAEMREKMVVAENVLRRTKIRAPRTGTVQNLHVATVGGVITPGEPLAELIPDDENLIINAQVSPADVDAIHAGMQVEVTLAAFHGYTLPLIMGRVESVSQDRIVNQESKAAYFLARVVVDKKDVPSIVKHRIRAGMPAEVIGSTGERTVMSYLMRPLRSGASSAFREK